MRDLKFLQNPKLEDVVAIFNTWGKVCLSRYIFDVGKFLYP